MVSSCASARSARSGPLTDASPAAGARFCPVCESLTDARECLQDGMPTVPLGTFSGADDAGPGRIVNGRYRLGEVLAEGGMGCVYRARQLAVDRPIAIKLMRPGLASDKRAVQRFYREARAAGRLVGPHFARVHDFGFDDHAKTPFIAMELLDGPTLAELAPLPARHAAALLAQVADALVEAEASGIVHRDIKAANIIVTRDEAGDELVKVTDFGVAKHLDDGEEETLTHTGAPVGTPSSMAPEQIRGVDVDVRTDLYALGCLLHRVLTGDRVFETDQLDVMMHRHLVEAPPALPLALPNGETPPQALVDLRDALLAKVPADRPASPAEVRDVLLAVARGAQPPPLTCFRPDPESPRGAVADLDGETWEPDPPATRPRGLGWPAAFIGLAAAATLSLVVATGGGDAATDPPLIGRTQPDAVSSAPVEPTTPVVPSTSEAMDRDVTAAPVEDVAGPIAIDVASDAPAAPAEDITGRVASDVAPGVPDGQPTSITVESRPRAWLHRDGERLGRTPYRFELPSDAAPFEVELRGAGYRRAEVTISAAGPAHHLVVLEPARGAPAPTPEPATIAPPAGERGEADWRPRPF